MSGSDTWGIDGTTFLLLYGALCAATAVTIWLARRTMLNTGAGFAGTPELDAYEMALLNDGPQLAITTVATKLHGEHVLGSDEGTTIVAKTPPEEPCEIEREVYDAIQRTNGMSSDVLRRTLENCASIRSMQARLTDAGLLLEPGRRLGVRALCVLALPVLMLGAARVFAGWENDQPILFIAIATFVVGACTLNLAKRRTWATARGNALLAEQRERTNPDAAGLGSPEFPLAIALFGAGVLWLAAPQIASAWSVPRDAGAAGNGGSGGCGGGCGGCGGCGG
jgi:uncharacterized protein (TIGR04222 family)